MTIRIKKDTSGAPIINPTTHLVTLFCDVCGGTKTGVNLNTDAHYHNDDAGNPTCIYIKDADINGTCDSVTSWPLDNGTDDAKAIVIAKTA